jgi:hypothetical protein
MSTASGYLTDGILAELIGARGGGGGQGRAHPPTVHDNRKSQECQESHSSRKDHVRHSR